MSFTASPPGGSFWLAPGTSVQLVLWFPVNAAANQEQVGADRGAQWIMADANDWASLTVSNFTKTRKNLFGVGNYVQYGVTVTNTGVYPAFFALQGGGNT